RRDRIRLAVRPFRIDVDETHLHGGKRILQLALAAVAFVPQPRPLRTPVEFFGLPDVGATAAETERLEAHRLQRDVTRENHKIGPGDFPAVFLLIGHSSRRALSRFALSGQLLSGAKRCWPAPAPPRPSAMRYVPAACHAMRIISPPISCRPPFAHPHRCPQKPPF